MSTLDRAFIRRAGIAVGGLILAISVFVAREAFGKMSCSVTTPYAPDSPVTMACSRPFAILDYDKAAYWTTRLGESAYMIIPVRSWTGRAFDFSYRAAALPLTHRLSAPIVASHPSVFFTDGAKTSEGTVFAAMEGFASPVAKVFSAPGSSRASFDGRRYFYFLKDDDARGSRPAVWSYDPARQEQSEVLAPPLGKTLTDFFPTSEATAVLAWEEVLENGQKTVSYMNGTQEAHRLQSMELDPKTVFESAIFAPDAITLSVVDRTRNRLVLYDTLEDYAPARSPLQDVPIIGNGFIGEKGDIPAFWTDKGLWSLRSELWSFEPMPGLLRTGACGNGKTFFMTRDALRDDAGPVAEAADGWSFVDMAVTRDCTPFLLSKDDRTGQESLSLAKDGALHEMYASPGPISLVGQN